MIDAGDVMRTARTVAELAPSQIAHRARLQVQRKLVRRFPDQFAQRWAVDAAGRTGLPDGFRAIDATFLADRWSVDDLSRGTFCFLNEGRDLGDPVQWDPPGATQLWLFHHHYWEWAWSLAAAEDRSRARLIFADHWQSWHRSTTFGRWDAWAPYPASLRAWVLVNVYEPLAAGSDLAQPLAEAISVLAGFLARNVELDIGGNHVVKNIKALVGVAVFLKRDDLMRTALDHLRREIGVQVLADGGHYELSPSYHCQVLADFDDMSRLLDAAGHEPVPELDRALEAMRRWLGVMLMPDGGVPLFNDCEPVEPALLALLRPGASAAEDLTVLPHSGYVVVRRGPFHLVADVGQPGPASPPGHIHADCLSFELAVDGERVVVDSGTSEYGSGPRRHHERSTNAHNTIEIDHHDQTEVWGAFRAGRRARATLESARADGGTVTVTASHDGYRYLPGSPLHRRTWTVDHQRVRIDDAVEGSGRHRLVSRLHLSFDAFTDVPPAADGADLRVPPGLRRVELDGPHVNERHRPDPSGATEGPTARSAPPAWTRVSRATGFGRLVPAASVATAATVDLPAESNLTFTVATRGPGVSSSGHEPASGATGGATGGS